MVEDARFEDAGDKPLRLMAADAEDLQIISSLIQDSVFPVGEMAFQGGPPVRFVAQPVPLGR